jgi:hypothetical protein
MIERGSKIKGFRFDDLNSAGLRWHESMARFVGVEGTACKISQGPHGVGSRFEIRFPREWDGDYGNPANTSWSNTIGAMYPLAECLALMREERLREIGI